MQAPRSINEIFTLAQIKERISEHPDKECFRWILALTGDYDLVCGGKTTIWTPEPKPSNWDLFQSHVAPNLSILKLDLSTVRSLDVWTAIQQTAPAAFCLPQLQTLHVSMDHVDEQIQFSTRFFSPTVRDLSLLVFPPQRRARFRSDTPRYPDSPSNELWEFLDAVAGTWYPSAITVGSGEPRPLPIQPLYAAVHTCKGLHRLQFVVADVHTAYATRHLLVDMIHKLKQLLTVVVARHTAVTPILALLSSHPKLQSFSAFQADFPLTALQYSEDADAERVYEDFRNIWDPNGDRMHDIHVDLRQPVRNALATLSLEIDPVQFLAVARRWKLTDTRCPRVKQLHLHCSTRASGTTASVAELHELLALLPALFPGLRELRVGPLRSAHGRFCVTAADLHALTPLRALTSLTLEAAYHPCVTGREWERILQLGRGLRVLRLPSTQPLYVDAPNAPLDIFLKLVSILAPHLEELQVIVAPVIKEHHSLWYSHLPALRQLHVAHDHNVPDGDRFKMYVGTLPKVCAISFAPVHRCQDRPDLDQEGRALRS
ncbi:hypothetical protein PsYK624_043020 [Phanerochaete sordida]|uniref:Uncharacterized protein n=1 Tax=Phanerochaete sordida TaxID=48140 RepID=A0A9P3G665_9APHY|nr:hypothetical protein PsYK624_043020 [Phanerochaete sordida]